MDSLTQIEMRLQLYEQFLNNPPQGSNFSNGSYERRAYKIALWRVLKDARKLLNIAYLREDDDGEPIPLIKVKQRGKVRSGW